MRFAPHSRLLNRFYKIRATLAQRLILRLSTKCYFYRITQNQGSQWIQSRWNNVNTHTHTSSFPISPTGFLGFNAMCIQLTPIHTESRISLSPHIRAYFISSSYRLAKQDSIQRFTNHESNPASRLQRWAAIFGYLTCKSLRNPSLTTRIYYLATTLILITLGTK